MFNITEKDQVFCKVCGETKTAGWHCGTITCEACKKFFLRNIKSEEVDQLQCTRGTNNCVITKPTRTICPHCRFKKCIAIGMVVSERSNDEAVDFKDINCVVCSDRASGLHFGAITCEGCKGFFRRSIDKEKGEDFRKIVCNGDGIRPCDITNQSRNSCRLCRYKKCLMVGMSQDNSKIGRQSNLFKQKLRSTIVSKGGSSTSIESMSDLNNMITANNSQNNQSNFDTYYTSNSAMQIKETLDDETNSLITDLTQAYQVLDSIQSNIYTFVDECLIAIELLKIHTIQCSNFVSNLPYFNSFTEEDKKQFLINAIHPIRLLQIVNLTIQTNQSLNYFSCTDVVFNSICNYFPCFKRISDFFKDLVDTLREMKLDKTEMILYTAFLTLSTSCKGLRNIRLCHKVRQLVCETLSKYMQARRSEGESCEQLISMAFRFEKINLFLEKSVNKGCEDLRKMGVRVENFYVKVNLSNMSVVFSLSTNENLNGF